MSSPIFFAAHRRDLIMHRVWRWVVDIVEVNYFRVVINSINSSNFKYYAREGRSYLVVKLYVKA